MTTGLTTDLDSAVIGHVPYKPPFADRAPCQNGQTPGYLQWSYASIGGLEGSHASWKVLDFSP